MTNQETLTKGQQTQKIKPSKLLSKIGVVASIMIVVMGSLTAVMTYMNVGFSETFLTDWLSTFALAALVMAPLGFSMMWLLNKLVDTFLSQYSNTVKNIFIGVLMAVIMEGTMSAVSVGNNLGFVSLSSFSTAWMRAFSAALPVGLVITVIMTMTVKPRLTKFMQN